MTKSVFDLSQSQPQVMAVLNVTPDSFSDGGSYFSDNKLSVDLCCQRVEEMVEQGASIIDIGGESTRPGAAEVSVDEELHRVLPVIDAIKDIDAVISLDSSTPKLIEEAAKLGIGMINDVRALQRDGAIEAAAATGLPVCLMHMQGMPQTMQDSPQYTGVLSEVGVFFEQRIAACVAAGIAREKLLLDPGFGFGKNLCHNATLLAELDCFQRFDLPLLVGLSRKSMLMHILGERSIESRLAGSLALAVMAVERGAWIVRAHDIQETADAIKVAASIMTKGGEK